MKSFFLFKESFKKKIINFFSYNLITFYFYDLILGTFFSREIFLYGLDSNRCRLDGGSSSSVQSRSPS